MITQLEVGCKGVPWQPWPQLFPPPLQPAALPFAVPSPPPELPSPQLSPQLSRQLSRLSKIPSKIAKFHLQTVKSRLGFQSKILPLSASFSNLIFASLAFFSSVVSSPAACRKKVSVKYAKISQNIRQISVKISYLAGLVVLLGLRRLPFQVPVAQA